MRELEERTGVNREVIRIMLREGLLPEPLRPSRNAAEYDEAHVRGVAAVRDLQRSSRMTLKEIKSALATGGLSDRSPGNNHPQLEALLAGRFGLDEAPPVDLATLAERSPTAQIDAAAFEKLGMLNVDRVNGQETLSLADARLVDIWGQIREAGFVEEAGFTPANIGFYLEAAQMVARREAEIFFGNSLVPLDDDESARMLHVALPLMLDFFGLLRLKAFMAIVREQIAVPARPS